MQPIGNSSSGSVVGKCQETSSSCVIWDGPDIICEYFDFKLCKGQSIETVVYAAAQQLCEILRLLDISFVQLENCLIPDEQAEFPTTPNQLFDLIIQKLCALDSEVNTLQNTGALPVLVDLPECFSLPQFANCPSGVTMQYIDANGVTVTKLVLIDPTTNTSPAVSYLTEVICDLLCRVTTLDEPNGVIDNLQQQITNIQNTISTGLPPVQVPACISATPILPLVDPANPAVGAVPTIANVLCSIINNVTGPLTNYPMSTNCTDPGNPPVDLANLPALGAYPGQVVNTLQDLGAIPGATLLNDVVNNMLVAICDLRNFGEIVKNTCCPSLCATITVDIGAVIPGGQPPNRNIVRFFLNGSQTDAQTNTLITSNFAGGALFPEFSPGYNTQGCSNNPPFWNINSVVTITVTDSAAVPNVYTNTSFTLNQFAANGFFVDLPVGSPPSSLDPTTDYTISYSVSVQAPDCTTCIFTDSTVLATTCDNLAVNPGTTTISDISANGFTLNVTLPVSASTPINYQIIITPQPGGTPITYSVPVGYSQYWFYPDAESYPSTPVPNDQDENWFTTDEILPNTLYAVCVIVEYDCGLSAPTCLLNFTTLVGIEINIGAVIAGQNNLSAVNGQLVLVPAVPTGPGDISANFTIPIQFNGITAVRRVVSCIPNLPVHFIFDTLTLSSAPWVANAATNCTAVGTTRGWGQVAASYFYPGNTYGSYFTDYAPERGLFSPNRLPLLDNVAGLIVAYDQVGCYDYIQSNISTGSGLVYNASAPTVITNINDGNDAGSNNRLHGTIQYSYNSQTYFAGPPPTVAIIAPPNSIGTFTISNAAHPINGGLQPRVYIKIDDVLSYIANKQTMWYGVNAGASSAGASPQSPDCVQYTSQVQTILGLAPGSVTKFGVGLPGNIGPAGTNANPTALPIFMRIAHYKWNGSAYQNPQLPTTTQPASNVYDITFDWLGLSNITNLGSSGFWLNAPGNGITFNLRDKLVITFTGGVSNIPAIPNPAYTNIGAALPGTDIIPSSVTIEQDPFAGIWPDQVAPQPDLQTGPFQITGDSPISTAVPADCVTYNTATGSYTGYNGLTCRGVPLNNFIKGATSTNALSSNYWNSLEIVLSHDVTITWSVG